MSAPTLVLVEGESDRLALDAAAARLGAGLGAARIDVLKGITNLRRRLHELRAASAPPRILGLYDAAEERYVEAVLRDEGVLAATPGRLRGAGAAAEIAAAGFFGCDRDLEDEVIRAAGSTRVIETLAARGEAELFRVFQGQPAQRDRPIEAQLHRFAGTASGRKARFAADVVAALPADRVPPPLRDLIHALAG